VPTSRLADGDDASAQFIEHFAVLLEADGLPRVAGRMFGLLLVSEQSRSLDELARLLAVSKASVSVNARLLEQRGVVERVGKQADRRDYYRIADDILLRSLEQRLTKIRRFQEAIADVRNGCVMKPIVRTRLENLDEAYRHLIDVTNRALLEWQGHARDATARAASSRSRSR